MQHTEDGDLAHAGCFHCGLPIAADADYHSRLEGELRDFCCFACQSVCEAIYEAGLQGYYQRTPQGTLLAPPPTPPRDIEMYDLDEVQQDFVNRQGELRDAHLLVEGIHCAACVWLIERGMMRIPGVLTANVNMAGKRLHLRWDDRGVKLSSLIRQLSSIGYAGVPYDPEVAEGSMKKANRAILFRLFFAAFAMMNLNLIAIALYSGADRGQFVDFFHWMACALATPTLLYSGFPFFKGAWSGLRNARLTMDLPIALGLSATYSYSLYVTLGGAGEVYFDTVTNLTFVILIGRYLEGMFRHQAVAATSRLMDLQPRVATVLRDGEEKIISVRAIQLEERVLVKPGSKIPMDGLVCEGRSSVDESMLSGESVAVRKQTGDHVSAGTLNGSGALVIEVQATSQDSMLAKIIRLVEEAQSSKAPIQRISDSIVPWFVLATLVCASITFYIWSADFEMALMAATSVLIITCPCALGMATPMSIAVASGLGAKHCILVKNGVVLETLSKVTHFVFDKTGTLTEGRMRTEQVIAASGRDEDSLLALAAGIERLSEHSVAQAIVRAADERQLPYRNIAVRGFHASAGAGVEAESDGRRILLGTSEWLGQHEVTLQGDLLRMRAEFEEQAKTCVHMAVDGQHAAVIVLADTLRADAQSLVNTLRGAGIGMTLLSGDRKPVVDAIARQLGGMEVIAEVLPQDKDRVIQQLQQRGECVAMVGDGVNDAPALIRADVGIALGSGTDVSVESADIVLMQNELDKVRLATLLSRRTLRTIKQNIGLSFVYNSIMVPLAMMAHVTPLVAAITMPISSLLVIGNAARIRNLFKG
ncbi:MAG: heavy metal translocating P-type ATPase [Nitrosomonadales bacterium]|nr:heavy metal translocating P-type ATPase [Nitrosomonadales bacterium]